LKFVPLWPNQTVFGGLANSTPSNPYDYSYPKEFYNRAEPYDSSTENIATAPLNLDVLKRDFVDKGLSTLDDMTIFDQQFFPRLVETKQAFRGDDTFALWIKAIETGVVCSTLGHVAVADSSKICAFARRSTTATEVEYCTYDEDNRTGIRSSVGCTTVARERDGKRWVLSTRYTQYGRQGAGGEGHYSCILPGKSFSDAAQMITNFLKDYIGKGYKISPRNTKNEISFTAEGIDIEDVNENVFLRLYVRGDVSKFDGEPADIGAPKSYSNETAVTVLTFFTISPQSSDNIVNYREPNGDMGNRLRNRFQTRMESQAKAFSSNAICGVSG
jgi:hypothetical protein